jgi:uncharacterized repeat protein (TIGR02543 family)
VTITAAQTLYAKWTVSGVSTVTFDAQGGTTPAPLSITVTNGLTYGALAATTRAGYAFAGWYTAVNGGGTQVTDSTTVTISAAQTLYAKWTVNAISTVTFDAQGGTTPVPLSATVTNGLTYSSLAATTRAGYTFAGWWTGTGGTGTEVTSGTTVTISAAQTLYAKWTVNAISTVTFDAQGGTTPVPLSMTVTNGLTYGVLATTTRSGYTLAGWYTAVNGGGTLVTASTTVTISAAQTLYAKWTVNAISTVTFDAQGGTTPVPLSMTVTNGLTYGTLAATTRAGYTFAGWYTAVNGGGTLVTSGTTVTITSAQTLYAKWTMNDAPVAQPQSVTTDEDTAKVITLVATDVKSNALTYIIATNPSHGTLSVIASNSVTYTPATNYFGADSFAFRATDGALTSTPATVSITVTPVNDAPVAQAQSVSTPKDMARVITLVATDVDTNVLTYAVVTGPLHGTLSVISSNSITYTPATNYFGADSFTFKANDGLLDSAPATVSIMVTFFNTAPVAKSQSVTTAEDTAKVIMLVATDAQTNDLTYAVVSGPVHGTLSVISSNSITYTPAANYNGPDSFTFKANDGQADSVPATVSITVTAVNDAPVAFDQTVTTPANTSVSVIMTGADAEGTALTFAVLTGPSHGTLGRVMLDRVTYTPAANYNGLDSFTMRSKDGTLTSTPATVYIRVGMVNINTAPVLSVISNRTVVVGETVSFLVQAHDTDIPVNTLTFALTAPPVPPANAATLDSHTGQFTWTAAGSDESKVFSFKVTVTDDGVPPLSTNQTFQVSVTGQPPVVGIGLLNGVPRLVWNSAPPRRYQLRFKDKLTDPAWTNLGGEVTATGATLFYDDESAQNHTNRFYRVLLIPEL